MTEQDSYDSPWKEAIECFFELFMAFFFPHIHAAIDWNRGYEFLDTELQQIVGDAETGKRLADKLVKVWMHDGEEAWLLNRADIGSPACGVRHRDRRVMGRQKEISQANVPGTLYRVCQERQTDPAFPALTNH